MAPLAGYRRPTRCGTWSWSVIPVPGKSSLVEALLAATGTIQRQGSIEEGTTVSDFEEVEIGSSVR